MKKLFFVFLFIFFGFNIYSQNEYIIDKDGKKITIDDGSTQMSAVYSEKTIKLTVTIYYKQNGIEKSIEFLDVKEAKYGNYKIDTFKYEDKDLPYFILIENQKLKLISFKNTNKFIHSFIIDENNNVIEDLTLNLYSNKKEQNEERAIVESKIRKHFSDCENVIKRLEKYKYNTMKNTYKSRLYGNNKDIQEKLENKNYETLMIFFDNPLYLSCK